VLLVFAARPGVPEEEIANFSRLDNYQRMSLRRLGAREVMELLEDAFKSETLAEELGVRIAKKSDGVPFFVFEMTLAREIGDRVLEADGTGNLVAAFLWMGCHDKARAQFEKHLSLAREIGYRRGEGLALAGFALLAEDEGNLGEATRLHTESLTLWRQPGTKDSIAESLVAVGRMEAMKGDVDAALAALAEHEDSTQCDLRVSARFRLWELTKDKAHLQEAHRLLCFMRDHAPEEYRTSMIENVPLHRDIMRAWGEHGENDA
jgi:tetratricopeptide (TPR) repeat protein